jgi:hypothetical protein
MMNGDGKAIYGNEEECAISSGFWCGDMIENMVNIG